MQSHYYLHTYMYMYKFRSMLTTYDDVQVRIDIIEVELLQDVLSRGGETLKLSPYAVGLKVAEQKEGRSREAKIVGVDIDHPAVPARVRKNAREG